MQGNDNQIFKLRLKLKTGEEFEAEGTLSFIEQQKEMFLKIANLSAQAKSAPQESYEQKIVPVPHKNPESIIANPPKADFNNANQTLNPNGEHGAEPYKDENINKKYSPRTDIWGNSTKAPPLQVYTRGEDNPANKYMPVYFTKTSPALKSARKAAKPAEAAIPKPEGSVWDRIAYPDGPHIIIRRKDKSITTAMAALIVLGSAKMLKNTPKMSALELSKSLKLSGYLKENERLDRILAPEIRQSCLVYEGSKRNRDYIITQSGTAKAYTAAERVLLNG